MNQLKIIIILTFQVYELQAKTPSYYPTSKLTNYKTYHLKTISEYFVSSGLFDEEENEVERVEGATYSRWDGDIALTYGFGRRLEIGVGGRYRQIYSKSSEASDEKIVAGFESLSTTVRYGFRPRGKWQYSIGGEYLTTLYENNFIDQNTSTTSDELDLGDAGTEITAGLYLDYFRKPGNILSAYLAYRYPPNDLSPEFLYRFEAAWSFNYGAFIFGMKGILSQGSDTSDSSNPKPQFNAGNTNQFNSINRSYLLPYLGLNFRFGRYLLGLRYGQTMNEISTDRGQQFLVSLDWNSKKHHSRLDDKLNSFKEYDIEATIIKISPRGKFLKIDRGRADDVEKGRKFDIYKTDFFGENLLLASGIIVEVGSDWSIIKLVKKYRKLTIKNGFTVRGYE